MRFLVLIFFVGFPSVLWAQSVVDRFQAVNSPYDEIDPVISPDGNTLFITIGNHPANVGGKKDPGDIWISRRTESQWSAPVHGGSLLNNSAYNAVAGLSADGRQLFLQGHYQAAGGVAKTQGISVSTSDGSGWSRPENISIPYFMNKSESLCGMVTPDNSVFIFSAISYGTYGADDIYVSVKKDGKWSEPKNLGTAINTQFQELSPSLSEDQRTLYFSSNGRKGRGSFDIYSATRLDDSWTAWSMPQNLGPDINSEGRELFYRPYPHLGFAIYTSTTSSDGYGDLKVFAPDQPLPLNDTVIYASIDTEKVQESSPAQQPLVLQGKEETQAPEDTANDIRGVKIYGKIIDARTGESISAAVSFSSPTLKRTSAAKVEDGYSIEIPSSEYAVRIEASGYVSALEKLDVRDFEMSELEMNFRVQPVEIGTTVNLKNVLFAQAKTEILPESYPELDLVVAFLKENPKVRIELMGHTDGRGVPADNVRLSQERVNKVKDYLVSKGIQSRRISGKGFGGSRPIASNDTEESRRMNRRVEFVIKKF